MRTVGKVTVVGVNGTVLWTGYVATKNKLVEWDYSKKASSSKTLDGLGDVIQVTTVGGEAQMNITIVPLDPATESATLANAQSNVKLPGELDKVTVAVGIADVDGDWHANPDGAGDIKPDSSGGSLKVTLSLVRYKATGSTAAAAPSYLGDPVNVAP